MKCKTCQKEIDAGYKMCPYCGEPVILNENDTITENIEQNKNQQQYDESMQQNDISNETTDESSQQTPKQRKSKGLIIAVFAIILVSAGVLGYFFLYLPNYQPLTQISQKIEAANEIDPMSLVELKNSDKYTLTVKDNQIKANMPGEYSVTYTLTNKKTNSAKDETFQFTVVDTTPPEIKLLTGDPIKAILGENVSITSLINVYDIVDGVITWEYVKIDGQVDYNNPGTYPLTVSVSDTAGNKATKTINIVEENRGVEYDFIKKIDGVWYSDFAKTYCSFFSGNGYYDMGIGNSSASFDSGGVLTFVKSDNENKIMTFNLDYHTLTYMEYRKYLASDVIKKTIIVDLGAPDDDKIFIDLGDGKGLKEYRYIGTQLA